MILGKAIFLLIEALTASGLGEGYASALRAVQRLK